MEVQLEIAVYQERMEKMVTPELTATRDHPASLDLRV